MTTAPPTDFLQSALATADWFLSCQKMRDKTRFETKLNELLIRFSKDHVDDTAYQSFLDTLGDVFNILAEGKVKGTVPLWVSTPEATEDKSVRKSFQELLSNTQDYLLFLFEFARQLDVKMLERGEPGTHVVTVIESLNNLEVQYDSEEEVDVSFTDFRLKMMMTGFNFLSESNTHSLKALECIINFASHNKLFEVLIPYLYKFDNWMATQTHLPTNHHRALYLLIIQELEQNPKHETILLHFLKRCIKCGIPHGNMDNETLIKLHNVSVHLLTAAISNMSVATFDDIFDSNIVHSLQNTEHAPLYNLGIIFYIKGLKEFNDFIQQFPDVITKYKLDREKCLEKMQLIVLSSMPLTHDTENDCHYISLQDIATQLGVSKTDAESLAVRAIRLKFIDGRIDQLKQIVEIRWNLNRVFGKAQWESLMGRLGNLQKNVVSILQELSTPNDQPIRQLNM